MPICEVDPWRLQYFEGIACPEHIRIPTEDADAWMWYPAHRWVYDKLAIAQSQGLAAGPHGTAPPGFPVFSKPLVNLRGMGAGSRMIADAEDYERHHAPGHFWMPFLTGRHVSSDAAVISGKPVWWRHATGLPAEEGMFDYWVVEAAPDPAIEDRCGAWLERHLAGYTGLVNVETIDGTIIEVHLRLTDQWPDLYGAGWVAAVIDLYAAGVWRWRESERREGYSLALFAPHGRRWRHPPADVLVRAKAAPGVSSVQITFHEDRPPAQHSMPPGGFRLALVNGHDLSGARAAREVLRRHFLEAEPAANVVTAHGEAARRAL